MTTILTDEEVLLVIEALAMAASRHESQGHVTRGFSRAQHDDKSAGMRRLRRRLTTGHFAKPDNDRTL